MSKHTRGPWAVCEESPNSSWLTGRTIYSTIEHSRVADVNVLRNDREAFADARLIAAAPELLIALNAMLTMYLSGANSGDWGNWNPEEDPEVIMARTAIVKATGETGEPA